MIADGEGLFEATVPLDEGENPLKVVSEDPLGRTSTQEKSLTRDNQPPGSAVFEVKY